MASERIQRRIEILLDEADEAIAKSDWAVVRDRAQNVLRLDPENNDALSYLAASERDQSLSPTPPAPAESTPTEPPSHAASMPEAERRQLTVMFCDLQGSTALSQQLDPEELREVIRGYQEVCAGAVSRFQGHIAKYLGDGLLIYFGYPQAHEDDPQRAVRAGLAILKDMGGLNAGLKADKDLEIGVRIGVHTGLVVAGEMGSGDSLEALAIVGETPNIAARLQEAAEPNSVVISDITANLIRGFFQCKGLGFHELKGISQPMELFAVVSESGAQTRFDIAAATRLTPLVGREQEVGLLLDRWDQAQEGLGQVVLLSGEAGIGKSRLIEELTERLAKEPHILRRLRCSAYHQNSALHPVLEHLEGWLGFGREDSDEDRLSKLESALAKVDFPSSEAVPILSGLLSVPFEGRFPELVMSPEVQRKRTHELLAALLLEAADDQPVSLILEDLHWADPSTLTVISSLIDQVPTGKVLAILSFRPEFIPSWSSHAYVTQIMLNRLTRRLAGDMVHRLTGGKSLPEEIFSQVVSKCDGVPLFVEELTRMVVESDLVKEVDGRYELTGPLPPLAIPSTLQDSLTARLDRLAEVREIAQIGAVLGREFTYELIQSVAIIEEETLRRHLRILVESEFLYQRGLPPEATYVFKHALIQDAAYNSLLISRRQQYHQRTAEVLEEKFVDNVETQPELLAHHFAEAGLTDKAVSYWQRAGERASASYAHEEALEHFQRGLDCKQGQEMDGETAALLFGLGRAQVANFPRHLRDQGVTSLTKSFDYYIAMGDEAMATAIAVLPLEPLSAFTRVESQLIRRALEIVTTGSHNAGLLLSRHGAHVGIEQGDYDGAQQALQSALAIAQRERDSALEVTTLTILAAVDVWHYHWNENVERNLRAIELAKHAGEFQAEIDSCLSACRGLYVIGDAEGARRYAAASSEISERLRHRTYQTRGFAALENVARLVGDLEAARDFSNRGLEISPYDSSHLMYRTLLEYQTGDFDQGAAYLERLLLRRSETDFHVAVLIPLIARITGEISEFNAAEIAAKAVLSPSSVLPAHSIRATIGLGLMGVERSDTVITGEQYPTLIPYRATMTMGGSTNVDRVLGLLAQTMGNLDKATEHFEDALDFCRKAGYRPELAWTCCDYADMLLERKNEGDRAKAMSLLDESLAISSELGMRPLMERVLSRRDILEA